MDCVGNNYTDYLSNPKATLVHRRLFVQRQWQQSSMFLSMTRNDAVKLNDWRSVLSLQNQHTNVHASESFKSDLRSLLIDLLPPVFDLFLGLVKNKQTKNPFIWQSFPHLSVIWNLLYFANCQSIVPFTTVCARRIGPVAILTVLSQQSSILGLVAMAFHLRPFFGSTQQFDHSFHLNRFWVVFFLFGPFSQAQSYLARPHWRPCFIQTLNALNSFTQMVPIIHLPWL